MTTKSTEVTIDGAKFQINGAPTYRGRSWKGHPVEGLLLNTRMVQGIFDDLNPETRDDWAYADTGSWDADRNTEEFIAAMPSWKAHGVLAFTINLQGGSPYGYSKQQPWINSAFTPEGALRDEYLDRLSRILRAADELGMVVIVGLFYFGQEKIFASEDAVRTAVHNAVTWLLETGHSNILLEINNECDILYQLPVLMPDGVHELIDIAKSVEKDGRRLLTGTSYGGGFIPKTNVVERSDFILIHGNGQDDPDLIRDMVRKTREVPGYRPMPILFNEDDHFDFDKDDNNFVAAVESYAGWGFFDYRMDGDGPDDGYQSVPVNWGISSPRKRGFFEKAKEIAGT
ncbi:MULTISPECIES: hypothetical protein [Marinovum]|jgi:hypothetical protein|uniref:Uncharacterized protein n=1 Tax=Marinovum algicola TaxID=42444 RepID=A0A975WEA6_9RHOB|nr:MULTISPECIES: hypothetical protein [Marinovum]MDD9740601.1 hypothetical protein [Marinovum sp. SP66]SEK06513.1 hypothetical protein SAMN04487940_12310 [Marinovum algicola]SLN76073.1 hypothetical protein MAA5396_04623 [Marinovum algicola]